MAFDPSTDPITTFLRITQQIEWNMCQFQHEFPEATPSVYSKRYPLPPPRMLPDVKVFDLFLKDGNHCVGVYLVITKHNSMKPN